MTDLPPTVVALIAARRLETVPADLVLARIRVTAAGQRWMTAQSLMEVDVDVAYVTAYDAARRAATAHMLATGLRARAVPRAHEAVGDYVLAMIATASAAEFQRIRRRRNKSEYDDIVIGHADARNDVDHCGEIVEAVARSLGAPAFPPVSPDNQDG